MLEARPDQHVVRSYREGDETAILRLFAESFAPSRGLDHWRWKYRDNPFGTLAISCAFGPDGELVAHYAAYPVPFRRSRAGGAETVLCHQVGDTMTDRRHRHVGRGRTSLLGRTARHFYARRCEGRVAFNYGFNTGNIQRFSAALRRRAQGVGHRALERRAGDLRLAAPRRFRPYRVTRVDRLERTSVDDFFERVAPHYGLLVERRRPYLEWRYLRCPDVDYRLYRVDRGGTWWAGEWRARRATACCSATRCSIPSIRRRFARCVRDRRATRSRRRRARDRTADRGLVRAPPGVVERASRRARLHRGARSRRDWAWSSCPSSSARSEELESSYYLTMGDSDLF